MKKTQILSRALCCSWHWCLEGSGSLRGPSVGKRVALAKGNAFCSVSFLPALWCSEAQIHKFSLLPQEMAAQGIGESL